MNNNKNKIQNVYKIVEYTVFYAARKLENLDRITVSEDTGISIKRISDLEKGIGSPPGFDEILNLEEYYGNNVIKEYFIELMTEGGYYKPMPKKIIESSKLEKYIALDRAVMNNAHIMTVLDISVGNAILIRKKLEFKAMEEGLILCPGSVIQTNVFEKYLKISKSDFENDSDVINFLERRGM